MMNKCRFFTVWSLLFTVTYFYNMFFIPFSIAFNCKVSGLFYIVDLVAVALMIGDSLLRPFLAINE